MMNARRRLRQGERGHPRQGCMLTLGTPMMEQGHRYAFASAMLFLRMRCGHDGLLNMRNYILHDTQCTKCSQAALNQVWS